MKGILKLAFKLLVNDTAKFTALLMGITFAVFLMMFVTSMFVGVLNHASATVINIGSTIWVMDPACRRSPTRSEYLTTFSMRCEAWRE